MTCPTCDWVQEAHDNDPGVPTAFLRIDNANVEVVACNDHILRLRELVLRGLMAEGQRAG